MRLPLAAEQIPVCVLGGALSGWDWGGRGEIQAVGPPAALQGAPPPGLQTSPWLLSASMGQVAPLRIPDPGRERHPVVGEGTVLLQARVGEGQRIAY